MAWDAALTLAGGFLLRMLTVHVIGHRVEDVSPFVRPGLRSRF